MCTKRQGHYNVYHDVSCMFVCMHHSPNDKSRFHIIMHLYLYNLACNYLLRSQHFTCLFCFHAIALLVFNMAPA